MKIIHLSDLHVGRGSNSKNFKIILEKIDEKYGTLSNKPVLLISGDNVDDGERWQYKKASKILDSVLSKNYKVLLCPGNHDYGWNGIVAKSSRIKRYGKYLSQDIDFPVVTRIDDCHFIALDTMEEERGGADGLGAEGEIGKEQLHELNYTLESIRKENPTDKIIVYLHHHPFYYNNFLRLKDADDLKEVIRARENDSGNLIKKVNVLLFGHKHDEKRFESKEKKYGIDLILASKKSTDIEKGVLPSTQDKPVFCVNEIDTDTFSCNPIELLA